MKTIKNLTADELRKSILQLAIQGKLVKQNPDDEPASELVKRIYEEKNKLIAEGKIKKDKNQSYIFKGDDNYYYEKIGNNDPVKLEELPFDIPENWTFIKLESFTHSIGNKNNQIQSKDIKKSGKYPVVSQSQNLIDGYHDDNTKLIRIVENDPIILFGDHTRNIKLINFSFIIGADGTKLFKPIFVNINYLFYCLTYVSYKLRNRGYARHYSLLKSEYIPLPPLEEQQRIVDKINSFEPLLEKYDKIEKELSKLEQDFPEKLKKSILQYAIEGKLVKQDPNDEPASVLLERIKQEKERLIKEGKIKQDKNESYIYQGDDKNYYEKVIKTDREINVCNHTFSLPNNWCWCSLSQLSKQITDGTHKTPNYQQSGVPFLSIANISSGIYDKKPKYISRDEHLKLIKRCKPELGDILLCRIGTLGKPFVNNLNFEYSIFVSLALIKMVNNNLSDYIKIVLDSPNTYSFIDLVKVGGGTHTFKINIEDLSTFPIPLPPIKEQSRIIKKVNFIIDKIDNLMY